MLVNYSLRPILLSALAVLTLLYWSGCKKYSTAPIDQPPPPPASSDTLRLSNASGARGASGIAVDVNLHNVEPVAGVQMRITYDSTALKISNPPFVKPSRADQMGFYEMGASSGGGVIYFTMFAGFGVKGTIGIGDGPILQLLFDAKSSATIGATLMRFENSGNNINALSDTLGTLIIPQLVNGTFTVQ